MAFTKGHVLTNHEISVVVKLDSALDMTDEEYEDYLQDCDESKLKLLPNEEPTRFIIRTSIPLKHKTRIQDSSIHFENGEATPKIFSLMNETIRASLIDIKNPESVPKDQRLILKKTGDGLADESTMEILIDSGVVQNLFTALQNYKKIVEGEKLKK